MQLPAARTEFNAGLRAGLQLPAGIVAIAVAWRYRVTFGTIVAGLAALHLFDWMF